MTDRQERWPSILIAALVAQIPFELRYPTLGLSNLQWTFLAAAVACTPMVLRNLKDLLGDRLVQAAALFVAVQWLAAGIAPEFHTNAFKGALRFTAGFVLLIIVRTSNNQKLLYRVWAVAAGAAALYALSAYAGFGAPWAFRSEEFYVGQVERLSGSFGYPNTAAAYFGISLPIVWWSSFRPLLKWILGLALWAAITLTLSKGALVAVPLAVLAAVVLTRPKTPGWKTSAALVGLGMVTYALVPVSPYLSERAYKSEEGNPVEAKYTTPWNRLQQQPGVTDTIPLLIRNAGTSKWRSLGIWRVAVAYRWWSAETETFLKDKPPLIARLSRDVAPGEMIDVQTTFRTPDRPGKYVLVVELFSGGFDWFSQSGAVPALIQVDVQPLAARTTGQTDLSRFYNWEKSTKARAGKPAGDSLTASVPRSSLWRAALRMFVAHPFGVGPDNYRLQYGKYLGASSWNTQIYSNNLYLELLAGSGFLGLGAFALMILAIPWRAEAACLALAVFLIHGLVDVFLMTTPIYFAFWMLLGMAPYFTRSIR